MGLIIKSTAQKDIKIEGTNILLESIYLRIAFSAMPDGKSCEVALYSYASYEMFIEKKPLYTTVPTSNLMVILDLSQNETQSIADVLMHISKYYKDDLGYDVEITNI